MPASPHTIGISIVHLHQRSLQPSTVRGYSSAISFIHRLQNCIDPTSSQLVKKVMTGLVNTTTPKTTPLLPINKQTLHLLVDTIQRLYPLQFIRSMVSSLFLLSYYACTRAGEVVISDSSEHTLRVQDVQHINTVDGLTLKIHFRTFKHSKGEVFSTISSSYPPKYCPVHCLRQYLSLRGNQPGPLFLNNLSIPVRRADFSHYIKSCARLAGLPADRLNTHSFRIGRATQLAQDNASDATIRQVGRWSSTAFERYIHPNQISLPP